MTKYYRVHTSEQWFWLMKRIESDNRKARFYGPLFPPCRPTKLEMHPEDFKKDVLVGVNGNEVEWDTFNYFVKEENVTDFIEVSDLMEGEKMEAEGEPMTEIILDDLDQVNHGVRFENGEKIKFVTLPTSKLYPKVPMTEAEKKEFDKLKDEMSLDRHDLDDLLTRIKDSEDFPLLYHRLYVADGDGVESQLEFARAWVDPSLIEVIPEKRWNVKAPPFSRTNKFYYKRGENLASASSSCNDDEDQQFTADELKEYGLDDDMYEKVEVKGMSKRRQRER